MTKPFSNLLERMSPESRGRAEKRAYRLLKKITLSEIRQAVRLTQEELARRLRVDQAAISKIERQSDMLLSTLKRVLGGMGVELKVTAVFPEGEVPIQFAEPSQRGHRRGARA